MKQGIMGRIILTVILVALLGVLGTVVNKAAPIVSGNAAVLQLNGTNAEYVGSQTIMEYVKGNGGLVGFLLFVGLIAVWYKPAKEYYHTLAVVLTVVACTCMVVPAQAYYDVKDNPEFVEIGPNQTAFLIPMAGANKQSQGQFGSEAYLLENKVAAKRIQIPHVQVNTTWDRRDYFVPAAKAVIMDFLKDEGHKCCRSGSPR